MQLSPLTDKPKEKANCVSVKGEKGLDYEFNESDFYKNISVISIQRYQSFIVSFDPALLFRVRGLSRHPSRSKNTCLGPQLDKSR